MSNEIRQMINKIINLNESIDNDLKSDIDLIYKNHLELEKIGTKEQYSEYIKTIFPNSKVKDILYHASPHKFTKFNEPGTFQKIFFSEEPINYTYGNNIYIVKVDIRNPLTPAFEKEYGFAEYEKNIESYTIPINPEWRNNYHITGELPKYKFDGTIDNSKVTSGNTITVRHPDQIHILGSDEDIKGFKNFVKRNI